MVAGAITAKARCRGEGQIGDAGLALRLLAGTEFELEQWLAVLRRRFRGDIDGAAEGFGVLLGQVALGQRDGADKADWNGVERHGATGTARGTGVGRRQAQPTERGAVEIGIEAADIDVTTFARIGLQRDARKAAYGFAGIDVGELLNLLRSRQLNEIWRLLLCGARNLDGRALAHDEHFFERVRSRRGGFCTHGGGGGKHERNGGGEGVRTCAEYMRHAELQGDRWTCVGWRRRKRLLQGVCRRMFRCPFQAPHVAFGR